MAAGKTMLRLLGLSIHFFVNSWRCITWWPIPSSLMTPRSKSFSEASRRRLTARVCGSHWRRPT